MPDFFLENPWWLGALLIFVAIFYQRRRQPVSTLVVPFAGTWWKPTLIQPSRMPAILMTLGIFLLVLALARPQIIETYNDTRQEGHEVMLAIDLSGSMLAEDFEKDGAPINRLQAIKPVIQAFINDRPNDRIGLVVFAGKAYTLAPPTFDHEWLGHQVEQLKIGLMEDGTALGDGLGVSLTRLEHGKQPDDTTPPLAPGEKPPSKAKAFIVLLTDGANNKGLLTPQQAAGIAKARGVVVYTIGAGKSSGSAPFPMFDEMGKRIGTRRIVADLDEAALKEISKETGGAYFAADNTNAITSSFKAIDASQSTRFEIKAHRAHDYFMWYVSLGGLLVLAGALWAKPPLKQEVTA